ncbi:MAG: hypothetical protein N5P05_003497 [Chroococcopsis gigantea SAG 12.99]|jgi:glycosyltransferase involved in cell wall biosynthesis|nr:tetratricopeptide repeat protein [Chlorogloea purpurea SAG 13.99]MDV3001891.1 hypothetical protein [Chroococcopsis gigantea SAG 12.99]
MTKLSLCMIVKNEEKALPQCLDSVKNIVDEMVVMDTGSTDRTVEIAEAYGAIVPHYHWQDHFSQARNEALKYVTGDWVLVLDADEALSPDILPYIRAAMAAEDNIVINFIRHEIGALQSPYSLVSRLFRKHEEVYFTRPYHSIVDDSIALLQKKQPRWRVAEIAAIGILHYGYSEEMIASLKKYDRARIAMEGFYRDNPHDPYVCNKLGALYLRTGREKEGIKLLKTGLKANTANQHILYELHYHLANAYTREKNYDAAIKHYGKALQQPIMPQLKLGAYNNLGGLLQILGDLQNSLQAYEAVVKIDPGFAMGYYNLGMALKNLGQLPRAIEAYEKAIELNPSYAVAYQNLAVAWLKAGDFSQSCVCFQAALELYEQQGNSAEAKRLRFGLKDIGMGNL